MVIELVWLFVRVTVWVGLVVFTVTEPKFSEDADSVTGAMPVPLPESETVCGLFGASSPMFKVPGVAPSRVGVKVRARVQLPAAATGVPTAQVVPVETMA